MAATWVSVVPTFRPPPEVVTLVSILAESAPVIVSDDASPCTFDGTLRQLKDISRVTVIRNAHNRGIGRALNQGWKHAQRAGASWLLTVDQDSLLDKNYARILVDYADACVASGFIIGAIGSGDVKDASGPLTYPLRTVIEGNTTVQVTEEVVQSGTLWSVPGLEHIGGFTESFGMDAVDAAACLALRSQGHVIAVHPGVTLEHRIEGAQQVRILGRDVMVTGHSRARRTAIVRNRLRLFPHEFRLSPRHAVRTVRRSLMNVAAMPLRRRR